MYYRRKPQRSLLMHPLGPFAHRGRISRKIYKHECSWLIQTLYRGDVVFTAGDAKREHKEKLEHGVWVRLGADTPCCFQIPEDAVCWGVSPIKGILNRHVDVNEAPHITRTLVEGNLVYEADGYERPLHAPHHPLRDTGKWVKTAASANACFELPMDAITWNT